VDGRDNALVGRLLAVAVICVSVAACSGDDSPKYSTDEVVDAFERHGYVLVPFDLPVRGTTPVPGSLLRSEGREPFAVMVGSDREADEAWSAFESQQTDETFDARRANVVVSSDSGLRATDRRRILAALASLPDRGPEVLTAG
jgi:hypothetical protein